MRIRHHLIAIGVSSLLLFTGCGSDSVTETPTEIVSRALEVTTDVELTSTGGMQKLALDSITSLIGNGIESVDATVDPLVGTISKGKQTKGVSISNSDEVLYFTPVAGYNGNAPIKLSVTYDGGKILTKDIRVVIKSQDSTSDISYIDYTGAVRKARASAAKAEYHTGTGYGNTLFDSADNKCQNCHNELYDTWKSSMHGKSWTDPVFQSKFQDFLRTHLNKIGEDKTAAGGIVYSETKFKGVAQTCIKCHAPGAYYAGDFKVDLVTLKENATEADFNASKTDNQTNSMSTTGAFDTSKPTSVVAVAHTTGTLYQATFQIGHESNQEGINCAFCHSIETPRLMQSNGMDNGTYTLKDAITVGPHGPKKAEAGTIISYNKDATDAGMNKFFRLWGPEKYTNYASTPKGGAAGAFDEGKSKDGRYTMHSSDLNGTDGKVHYTGGPFYGPFGVSGKGNENSDDTTDRKAHINPNFHKDTNNHFGSSGKGLCLSCHQRSAGAAVPSGEEGAGNFMELCSTQMAVTTGDDSPTGDTLSSPKCQKCHMERIEGVLLHQWARPDLRFDATAFKAAVGYDLTPELDEKVSLSVIPAGEAPQRDGWLNSHAFLGASKTGHKTSATAKIKSGFSASLNATSDSKTLTVTTTLENKTAHMFPGAHPMRRVLTRIIVTANGVPVNVASSTGNSTFNDIENSVQPLSGKILHSSALSKVAVKNNGSANLTFPGKVADMDGSAIKSQKFSGAKITVTGADTTIGSQSLVNGKTQGSVINAAIAESTDMSNFTRIYGHETGKKYDGVFVVRPGFDSNMVESDNRLSPNETETYTLTYDITGLTNVQTTYKVYYMQKGANGKFLTAADGFLDQASSDAKKLLVTEVYSETK